ncbi:hypothetical protein ACEPAF_1617 [Sanghuangporus sanghuang]
MVASKISDTKRRRHTYAERTVTAISDIRRYHPRSPIHLKTLKAQIRRNAIAQNDVLGPRWRTGVNLACKLLTDQGVLEPEHPPSRIVLSPKGKQLIARTRHSIGLPDDHEHNQECDENLGRKIMHRLSYAPARTRRATSVATAGEEDMRKAPSKLTRAELLEENKKLRQEYEALKRENSRRVAELNAELEDREDEWLEYQDLASVRNDFSSDIGDITLVQDDAQHDKSVPARPETSTRAEEINVAERTGANIGAPRQLSGNRSSNLLIRTNTGSFISSISKQPTPAPSDAGTESIPSSPEYDTTFDHDVTLADMSISPTRGLLSDRSKVKEELRNLREQLGTAEGMRKALQSDKEKLQEDTERLKMDLLEKTADLESVRDLLQQKDREAEERAAKAQDMRQSNLESQLAELQQELQSSESIRQTIQAQLEKTQAESEGVKNSLQGTIKNLEKELTGAREREEVLSRKAKETRDECERLQVELQAATEQTSEVRNELASVQAKLYQETTERTRLETDLAATREQHTSLENTVSSLRSEILDVQTVLQTERDGAQKLHEFLREVVGQRDELLIDLETKRATLVEAQSTLAHKEAELALLREQLSSSGGTVTNLRTSLAMMESKVQNADARNDLLGEALRDAEEEVAELKAGYERLKRTQLAEFEEMDRTVTKKRKRATMPPLLAPSAENIDIGIDAGSEAIMPI